MQSDAFLRFGCPPSPPILLKRSSAIPMVSCVRSANVTSMMVSGALWAVPHRDIRAPGEQKLCWWDGVAIRDEAWGARFSPTALLQHGSGQAKQAGQADSASCLNQLGAYSRKDKYVPKCECIVVVQGCMLCLVHGGRVEPVSMSRSLAWLADHCACDCRYDRGRHAHTQTRCPCASVVHDDRAEVLHFIAPSPLRIHTACTNGVDTRLIM
eukprot:55759-Eustigmatos_ZCMA.PRE.3